MTTDLMNATRLPNGHLAFTCCYCGEQHSLNPANARRGVWGGEVFFTKTPCTHRKARNYWGGPRAIALRVVIEERE